MYFAGNIGKALEEYFGKMLLVKRSRIVVRKGAEFVTVLIEEIAFFHTEHKVVFVMDKVWVGK